MKIGIIGTGNMASGLGKRFARAGHEVMFGSRAPKKAQELAAAIGANASGGSQEDAAAFGEIVVLAMPFNAVRDTARSLPLDGKIVIETTNNMGGGSPTTTEQIQSWLPRAKVVKAFNTIFSNIIQSDVDPTKERAAVFIAGDDKDAKQTVARAIGDIGFDAVDAGPARNAVHLENLVRFVIELGQGQGYGRTVAFKLVRL